MHTHICIHVIYPKTLCTSRTYIAYVLLLSLRTLFSFRLFLVVHIVFLCSKRLSFCVSLFSFLFADTIPLYGMVFLFHFPVFYFLWALSCCTIARITSEEWGS